MTEGKRAQEQKAQRRRRTDTSYESYKRLGVNEDLLDRKSKTYRWVNDSPGRIEAFNQQDDWEFVRKTDIKPDGSRNEGAQVRQLVGSNPDGSPMYAYLMEKPLEFHEEDQRKKLAKSVDAIEAQLKGGVVAGGLSVGSEGAYIPSDGISITAKAGRRAQEPYTP